MTFDLGEYDHHEKSEVKDGELKLSWRMDPEESWSDWTISVDIKQSVKADDNLIADINIDYGIVEDKLDLHRDYHVHKAQVSVFSWVIMCTELAMTAFLFDLVISGKK